MERGGPQGRAGLLSAETELSRRAACYERCQVCVFKGQLRVVFAESARAKRALRQAGLARQPVCDAGGADGCHHGRCLATAGAHRCRSEKATRAFVAPLTCPAWAHGME